MSTVSIDDLQQDVSRVLDRVAAGEHMVVLRGGEPIAELRPIPRAPTGKRPYGLCAGAFTVPADFDEPLPEDVLREFEGR